jgi:hypothetical protein
VKPLFEGEAPAALPLEGATLAPIVAVLDLLQKLEITQLGLVTQKLVK